MKAMICEMCNSNDLLKTDGLFVCQHCGTKYTVEEARKLFVEGSVKIDRSEELKNLYELAKRAKTDGNTKNAQRYYEQIITKDPTSWEANFYTIYYQSMNCKIGEIASAATNVNNCITGTFQLIRDYVHDNLEKQKAIVEVRDQVRIISDMLFNAALSHWKSIDPLIQQNYQNEFLLNVSASGCMPTRVCDSLCSVFADDEVIMRAVGIRILKERIEEGIAEEAYTGYIAVIKKYDLDYRLPNNETENETANSVDSKDSNSGGCYVATAVYGSYDCPQVWTLRRYRDDIIAETWYGRVFIKTYYAISPTLVKWFGDKAWFKTPIRKKLDTMVKRLNSKGVENTPYNDKQW